MDSAGDIGAPASGLRPRTSRALIAMAVVLLAVAAAAGGALAVSATSPGASAAATGTRAVVFDPFSTSGHLLPAFHVTAERIGTCVVPGVARHHSYRCFSTTQLRINAVYDPCFASPAAPRGPVYCVTSPLSTGVVRFHARSLPSGAVSPGPGQGPLPWAIELANGRACMFVAAAWVGAGPYACLQPHGRVQVPLIRGDCRVPLRRAPWWVAPCQARQRKTSAFRLSRILVVWY